MATFSDMLTYLRKQDGLSQKDLADKTGLTRSAIGMYETGKREPDFETLEVFADFFNVNMDTLLGKSGTTSPKPTITLSPNMEPLPQMREWPVLGATACGKPLHRELLEETVLAPEDIKADIVFRCVGDSMINARIFDGDAVFIRTQPEVENGQIAVVRVGDEYTLKRVYVHEDYVELRPENPTCEATILRGDDLRDDNFEVVGLAVAFLSSLL